MRQLDYDIDKLTAKMLIYKLKTIFIYYMSQNKTGTIALIIFLIAGLGGIGYLFMNPKVAQNQLETKSQSSTKISTSSSPALAKFECNDKKEPSVTSETKELRIEDICIGSGKEVKSGDTISINYKGTLLDGTEFDSSYKRNQAFSTKIGVGQVIKGWDQGIVGLKEGGKRKLTIPADLAYGAVAKSTIPANSTLVFEVELMGIK
jgi:FKBP-type peptidyl-prolyl cis-trans isomerase